MATRSDVSIRARAHALGLAEEFQLGVIELMRSPAGPAAPALEAELRARGVDAATLLRMASADALAPALAGVGFVLAGVALTALVLCFLLPRATGRRTPGPGKGVP